LFGRQDVLEFERPENHQDYREEARRIRLVASDVKNVQARAQLLLIASLYEKLAEHVRQFADLMSDNVP
jgi:hypothetical protein